MKGKMGQLDLAEIKNFCSGRTLIRGWKNTLQRRDKIFSNYVSNRGLLSWLYKELSKTQEQKKQQFKGTKDTSRHLTKEYIQVTSTWKDVQHHQLLLGKWKLKTTMGSSCTPLRVGTQSWWDPTIALSEWKKLKVEPWVLARMQRNWIAHASLVGI